MKEQLILALCALSKASKEILKFYRKGFEIYKKSDGTPLTSADKASHKIICDCLKKSSLPILSEEGAYFDYNTRKNWESYWLLDPIDGTKEFINKSDQFCISLALIKNRKPIMGLLFAPQLNIFYFACQNLGAYKFEGRLDDLDKILNSFKNDNLINKIIEKSKKLPFVKTPCHTLITSPYKSKKTETYLEGLRRKHPKVEIKKKASALKLGLLAEGKGDEYIRFNPMFEWDLAGGHAILLYSGFIVKNLEGQDILYNNEQLKIQSFRAHL